MRSCAKCPYSWTSIASSHMSFGLTRMTPEFVKAVLVAMEGPPMTRPRVSASKASRKRGTKSRAASSFCSAIQMAANE